MEYSAQNKKKASMFWPLVNSTAQSFSLEQIRKVNWRKLVVIYVVGVNVDTAASAVAASAADANLFVRVSCFFAGVSLAIR